MDEIEYSICSWSWRWRFLWRSLGCFLIFLLIQSSLLTFFFIEQQPTISRINQLTALSFGRLHHPLPIFFKMKWLFFVVYLLYHWLRPSKITRSIQPIIDLEDFVIRYGSNSSAYLTLESDKTLFFGESIQAVWSYRLVNHTLVFLGDPICRNQDLKSFLQEVVDFCYRGHLDLIIFNAAPTYRKIYEQVGLTIIKSGEEAVFDLATYTLKGKSVAKIRTAINKAHRLNLEVFEYTPLSSDDPQIKQQLESISQEWLATKGAWELEFSVGGVHFDDPQSRRYFYCWDSKSQRVLAFVVFLPYSNQRAYLADVTRRRWDAPQGALEFTLYSAWQQLKSEGVDEVSMGLAPLSNLATENQTKEGQLLELVYRWGGCFYDFQALRHAKKKFSPTQWRPAYYCHSPKMNRFKFIDTLAWVHLPNDKGRVFRLMVRDQWQRWQERR